MRAAGLLAALVVALAVPGTASATSQARAAGCSSNTGVTVVVDFHELGGGVDQSCVTNGGGQYASDLFTAAGESLTYVTSQPGAVCRVEDKPGTSCEDMPPADAYWALYWSDGKSTAWTYASRGATGLAVPDGGSVAFSWHQGKGATPPGVNPRQRTADAPSTKPTAKPSAVATPKPTKKPTATPSAVASPVPAPTAAASTTAPTTPTPSAATPTPTASASAVATPTVEPSTTPSEEATASAAAARSQSPAAEKSSGGLPWWLPTGVLVVLLGGIGTALWRRRAA